MGLLSIGFPGHLIWRKGRDALLRLMEKYDRNESIANIDKANFNSLLLSLTCLASIDPDNWFDEAHLSAPEGQHPYTSRRYRYARVIDTEIIDIGSTEGLWLLFAVAS
jgi:hypothetical protein